MSYVPRTTRDTSSMPIVATSVVAAETPATMPAFASSTR